MIFKQHSIKASIIVSILIFSITALSCVTTADTPGDMSSGGKINPEPVYYGAGSGSSAIAAMNAARREAVNQAAADLLSKAAVLGQEEEIEVFIASINDFTPFVVRGSQVTLESSSEGGYYYLLGLRVNLSVLADRLKSNGILGGQVDGREGNQYSLPDQRAPAVDAKPADTKAAETKAAETKADQNQTAVKSGAPAETSEDEAAAAAVPEATAEELAIISEYIDSLTYMVYFNEETAADPFLSRTAVTSANRYLEKEGFEYVDLAQIEKIKTDQQMVYEEETGEAVSIIQWIAHKLNADIYIEVSLDTNSRIDGNNYYGSANVSLNCYNASTAEGRGSASYQTNPPAFSRVSEADALANAVSSAVFKGMKAAVAAAENETARAAVKGFRYSLRLMNTDDSRMMRDFEKKLEQKVKDVKRISYSPEESVFEVYLIDDISGLEDLVYDTAESIPGMEGILLIMQRGNSITFDTGL